MLQPGDAQVLGSCRYRLWRAPPAVGEERHFSITFDILADVSNYLICASAPGPWRVDIQALDSWLEARWPGTTRRVELVGTERETDCWTLPNLIDVRVSIERESVWLDADGGVASAVAAWCARSAEVELIVTDDGYSNPVGLQGLDEEAIKAALLADM